MAQLTASTGASTGGSGASSSGDGASGSGGAGRICDEQGARAPPAELPAAAHAELRAAFRLYDRDKSGTIDMDELRLAMTSLGARAADAERTMAAADANGDGVISFDEARPSHRTL
jgi:hypothetical protein